MTPKQYSEIIDSASQNPEHVKRIWDLAQTQALHNFDVADLHKLLHIYRSAFDLLFSKAADEIGVEITQLRSPRCRCGCCNDFVVLSLPVVDQPDREELARDEDIYAVIYQLAKTQLRHA